ncbi:MAG: hypothetical protein RL196_1308, partial [Actinomycetota bacterium]
YIGALGEGFNTTISVAATGSTATAQIVDMNGSVVATIDIPTAGNATGPTSFQSFDEYGVPETIAITNSRIQNFGWAGNANRQTETTGLILMGARVYNPVTGQFTSPDPIPGGNETTYTYPNDPINQNDYTGCIKNSDWMFWGGLIVGGLLTASVCAATVGIGCVVAGFLIGGLSGGLESIVRVNEEHLTGIDARNEIIFGFGLGAITGSAGGAATRISERIIESMIMKKSLKKLVPDVVGTGLDIGLNHGTKTSMEFMGSHNSASTNNKHSSNKGKRLPRAY